MLLPKPKQNRADQAIAKWTLLKLYSIHQVRYAIFAPELAKLHEALVSAGSHTYSCAPAPAQYAINDGLNDIDYFLDDYTARSSAVLKVCAEFCYE